MTDSPQDDARLRATEAQMRNALGLRGNSPSRSTSDHPMTSTGGSQPPRRRFVRDGEVPVTVIRRDYQPEAAPGTNQLDAARQAIRSETMARQRAERSLEEAQITIRDLRTKLAHERLAKTESLEAAQRAATVEQGVQQTLQSVQAELAAQRLVLRNTEDALAEALGGRLEAEDRLRQAISAGQARKLSQAPYGRADATTTRGRASAGLKTDAERHVTATTLPEPRQTTKGLAKVDDGTRTIQARRRGRPAVAGEQESEIVKWWKPRSVGGTVHSRGRGRPKGSKNRPKP